MVTVHIHNKRNETCVRGDRQILSLVGDLEKAQDERRKCLRENEKKKKTTRRRKINVNERRADGLGSSLGAPEPGWLDGWTDCTR